MNDMLKSSGRSPSPTTPVLPISFSIHLSAADFWNSFLNMMLFFWLFSEQFYSIERFDHDSLAIGITPALPKMLESFRIGFNSWLKK